MAIYFISDDSLNIFPLVVFHCATCPAGIHMVEEAAKSKLWNESELIS